MATNLIEEPCHGVCRMVLQPRPVMVVSSRRPRVAMAEGILQMMQWDSVTQRQGCVGMPQNVRGDDLSNVRLLADASQGSRRVGSFPRRACSRAEDRS